VGGHRVGHTPGCRQHHRAGGGRGLEVVPAHRDVDREGQRGGDEAGEPPGVERDDEHGQEQDRGHDFAVGDAGRGEHARDQEDDD
jgi:hypothetical protein